MGWKALLPGIYWMAVSLVVITILSGLRDSSHTSALFGVLRWGPAAMFGWGICLMGRAAFRLWQWHQGVGPICSCGGLLGSEIHGRFGSYRKCLACSNNVNQRHYS